MDNDSELSGGENSSSESSTYVNERERKPNSKQESLDKGSELLEGEYSISRSLALKENLKAILLIGVPKTNFGERRERDEPDI